MNQGRLRNVMVALIVAMTSGSMLLYCLQGKHLKPMGYSLSAQQSISSSNDFAQTAIKVSPDNWSRIEITYQPAERSLLPQTGQDRPTTSKYHFVISDGTNGYDGQTYHSQHWDRQRACQVQDYSWDASKVVRICVISYNASKSGTPRQTTQLENLVDDIRKHCRITPGNVSTL